MTSLETVKFVDLDKGVPTYFYRALLLAPRLRAIRVSDQSYWPRQGISLPDGTPTDIAQVQELVWTRNVWLSVERHDYLRDEMIFFLSFIPRLRPSLRVLHLPVESACYRELLSSPWPFLVELHITGQNTLTYLGIEIDFCALLRNIPTLHLFSFRVPQSTDSPRVTLFPSSSTPFPVLESLRSLTISYPSPDDNIFDCLPSSMRELRLTDWPPHYIKLDGGDGVDYHGWPSPILTSSEVLTIFRRLHCPDLESLEVVYEADERDENMLLHMVRAFPALKRIKLFRYQSSTGDPLLVNVIVSISCLLPNRRIHIHTLLTLLRNRLPSISHIYRIFANFSSTSTCLVLPFRSDGHLKRRRTFSSMLETPPAIVCGSSRRVSLQFASNGSTCSSAIVDIRQSGPRGMLSAMKMKAREKAKAMAMAWIGW